jgi:arginase
MKTQQFHNKFTILAQNRRKKLHYEAKKLRQWKLIGVGSGWGARDMGTAEGPKVLMEHIPALFQNCQKILTYWHKTTLNFANNIPLAPIEARIHADHVFDATTQLCDQTKTAFLQGKTPLVLGGDHSVAIGTWSGIKAAVGSENIGLIWIDAHLDAHTPETSPSRNIHGMPVAVLLGHGDERFIKLGGSAPKFKPEHVCLIGIRSFEEGEEKLLHELGVKIYYMKEVHERGFESVFREAQQKLSNLKFGISIDIDAFDPQEAPGTGTREKEGIKLADVKSSLQNLSQDPNFLALEITEFNPHKDVDNKTLHLIWNLARLISGDLT